jgi:hypothetical protein
MAREVTGPDGRTSWKIRRRVLNASVTPRWQGAEDHPSLLGKLLSPLVGNGDSLIGIAGLFVALVILPVLFAFYLIPVVLFALETVVFLGLAGYGLFGRVVLRRPWRVEAWSSDGDRCFWLVPGFRNAAEAIDPIAAALRNGHAPPRLPGATGPSVMVRRMPRRHQRA